MVNLDAWRSSTSVSPDSSLLARILPVSTNNAILVFGPSKSGKTRLVAWEAAALAATAPRRSALFIVTEANYNKADIADIIAACAAHNVSCQIDIVDDYQSANDIVEFARAKYREMLTNKKSRKKKGRIEIDFPSVVVLDSVSGFSELVIAELSDSEASGGMVSTRYSTLLIKLLVPLRAVVNATGGVLLLTAQSTPTIMSRYKPWVKWLQLKPRYMGPTPYAVDAEVFLSERGALHETLKRRVKQATDKQMAVVVEARRTPEAIGAAAVFHWEREQVKAEGELREEITHHSIHVIFNPNSEVKEEVTGTVLKPVVDVVDRIA